MEEVEEFVCVGIVLPDPESPGLGTPVFRRSSGTELFIQEFDEPNSEYVDRFVPFTATDPELIPIRSNVHRGEGSPLTFAALLPEGVPMLGTRSDFEYRFSELPEDYPRYPFFYYHLSSLICRADHIVSLLGVSDISKYLRSGVIERLPLVGLNALLNLPARGWNDRKVEVLRVMWLSGYSAAEIGTALGGLSRNAVLGKLHRLGMR